MIDEVLSQRLAAAGEHADRLRTALFHVDTEFLDLDQLGRARALSSRVRSVLDGFDADLAMRANELRRGGNERLVDNQMNPDHRRSSRDQRRDEERGQVYHRIPGLHEATREGVISGDYADMVTRHTKQLDGDERAEFDRHADELAEAAITMNLHRFGLFVQDLVERIQRAAGLDRLQRQQRNRKATRRVEPFDGMYELRASFDPEVGAAIFAKLDAKIEALFRTKRDDLDDTRCQQQLTADALAELILNPSGSGTGVDMLTIIDYRTLTTGELHDGSVHETGDGTRLPAEVFERLACEANVIPIFLNGSTQPLAVGRRHRLATRPQRLALRAIYRTCAIDGCDVPFDRCQIHHVNPWTPTPESPVPGTTDIRLLVPVCHRHHDQAHVDHWRMHIDPATRALRITLPDGSIEIHEPPGLPPPKPPLSPAGPADRTSGSMSIRSGEPSPQAAPAHRTAKARRPPTQRDVHEAVLVR